MSEETGRPASLEMPGRSESIPRPPVIPPRARGRPPPPAPASAPVSRRESENMATSVSPHQVSPRQALAISPPISSSQTLSAVPSQPATEPRAPASSRTNSSVSSNSALSARQSPPSNGRNTSCSVSTSETAGPAVGTPEATPYTIGLGVLGDHDLVGRKMSYTLQAEAPLSQATISPRTRTTPTFSSPTLGASSRRGSRNDDLLRKSESSPSWTPPGRISGPAGVSPSSVRSASQHSPDPTTSPRLQSTGSYLTKRQQQTQDLRSEVEEENRKRRERRTVVVKDGCKIVDGVRAKASSSGVYTPTTFPGVAGGVRSPSGSSVYTPATLSPSSTPGVSTPNGFGGPSGFPISTTPGLSQESHSRTSFPSPGMLSPSLSTMSFNSAASPEVPTSAGGSHKSRHFFPSALARKRSSGLSLSSYGDPNHNGILGSAVSGMRSLSVGIETWRKHSVSSPAPVTEYDNLLRRESMERPTQYTGRDSMPEGRYERNASLPAVDLPEPTSPRRQSEPYQRNKGPSFGMGTSAVSPERQGIHTATSSTMGSKNVKGLRLPLSDMHNTSSTMPKGHGSSAARAEHDQVPNNNSDASVPGLLSPAIISGGGKDSISSLPSPPLALAPALSMGVATKGTRRKPVPATFATTATTVRSTGTDAVADERTEGAEISSP